MFQSNDAVGTRNEYKMNPTGKDNSSEHSSSGQFDLENTLVSPANAGVNTLICPGCGFQVPQTVRICPNDGTDLLLQKGQMFADKFELLGIVGSGGMGVIYRAKHLILDKIVAIKVLHANANDANLIMRFQREAKAASSLSHVNLITINDFGILNGTQPYMVMDYIAGKTLSEYLDEHGTLEVEEALELFAQIVSGVAHAHKKGVLHRDLKPGNIMLIEEENEPRQLKILDFGLAKLIDLDDQVNLSASGVAMGSPAYMSPEQATGMKADRRCDLYSLGCILFEMLVGAPPLLGNSPTETLIRRLNEDVPGLSDKSVKVFPEKVEKLVITLLQRDPQDRYQTAEEVRDLVDKLLRSIREETSSGWSTPSENGSTDGGSSITTPGTTEDKGQPRSQPPRRLHPKDTVKDLSPTNPLTDPVNTAREHGRRMVERPARISRTDLKSPGTPGPRTEGGDSSCRVRSRISDQSLPAIKRPSKDTLDRRGGYEKVSSPSSKLNKGKRYEKPVRREQEQSGQLFKKLTDLPTPLIITLILIVVATLWVLISLLAH